MTEHRTTPTMISPRTAAAGLAGIALLTLTACGGGGEASSAESSTPEVPPAPEYTEIESDIWDTMLAAESVTIEADVPASMGNPQAGEGARATIEYAGATDGSASSYRRESQGVTTEMRLVDDSVYVPGEVELASIERNTGGAVAAEDHQAQFEGTWVDYTDRADPSSVSSSSFLTSMRSSMEGRAGAGDLDAEAETRDGEGVWTYTSGEDLELVVRAGEEPVLLSIDAAGEGASLEVTFSEWNSSQGPEAPATKDILSLAEVRQIVTG